MLKNKGKINLIELSILTMVLILTIVLPNKIRAAVIMTKLDILQAPDKTVYKEGEDFDKTGMIVQATYSDGTEKEITDYKIARGTNLERNQKSVLIFYTEGDREIEAIQPISVGEENPTITVSRIEIKKSPDKTVYKEGEDFDKTGMVVEAIFSDGTRKEITDYKIARGTNLELDQKSVLIFYTEGDREIEAIQPITIERNNANVTMTKIEIKKAPNKTVYKEGEKFDKTGMIVEATYSDGTKKEITDYKVDRGEKIELNQKDVLIYYTEGDKELEAIQPITVQKNDNKASTKLPNTGTGTIVVSSVIIILTIGVVSFVLYKKYQKIR